MYLDEALKRICDVITNTHGTDNQTTEAWDIVRAHTTYGRPREYRIKIIVETDNPVNIFNNIKDELKQILENRELKSINIEEV